MPDDSAPEQPADSPEVEVLVLGSVVVTWPGMDGRRAPQRRKLEEVVAYLATHDERPVLAERLRAALWPVRNGPRAGEVAGSTFRSTMSRPPSGAGTGLHGPAAPA